MAMTDMEKRETATPGVAAEPQRPVVTPPVDIFENDEELLLTADMPGVSEGDLDIRVERERLTIEGRWSPEVEGSLVARGFRPMDYARSFTLPTGVDPEKISARLSGGVLTVHLPKGERHRPRQIKVTRG